MMNDLVIWSFALAIILAVTIHWIFDFVLQTEWMATNKSTSNKALLAHTSVYFLGMLFLGVILSILDEFEHFFNKVFTFAVFNFCLHTITDYITSRQTSRLWKEERVHDFFVMVGLDQWVHMVTLVMTIMLWFFW